MTTGKIYTISWHTESSDRGTNGYWLDKPTEAQVEAYLRKQYPCEFEDPESPTIYWEIVSHKLQPPLV